MPKTVLTGGRGNVEHLGLINHPTFVCDEEVWCKRPCHTSTSERLEAKKESLFIYAMHLCISSHPSELFPKG